MKEYIIGNNEQGQRLDKFIAKVLPLGTKGFFYKMLRKKNIVLNDKKAVGNEMLHFSDCVKFYMSDETFQKFHTIIKENDYLEYTKDKLDKLNINILYEDKHIVAFYKPEGILSQKAKITDVSMNDYLIGYLLHTKQCTVKSLEIFKPSILNRLDCNTSGIIVGSKTLQASQNVSEMIKNHSLNKFYKCYVYGKCPLHNTYEHFLLKDKLQNKVTISDENKVDAVLTKTGISALRYYKDLDITELEIRLYSGKTHQIRAVLEHLGFPIVGDPKYKFHKNGKNRFPNINHQSLYACKLIFPKNTKEGMESLSSLIINCENKLPIFHMIKDEKYVNMDK